MRVLNISPTTSEKEKSMWLQKEISLKPLNRGFHLITDKIITELPEIADLQIGMLNIFVKHTSASLCVNEDADPAVRNDFEKFFNTIARENEPYYSHTSEGPDDMPAHLKATIIGNSISIPLTQGSLNLGTWQGILFGEHRNNASSRTLILTLQGE